jgi:hypothetical protein
MVLLLSRSHHYQVVGHWNLALQLSHFLVSRYIAVVFNCSQFFNTVLSPSQCTIICQFVCWRSRASASHSLRALYYRFFLYLSQLGKLQFVPVLCYSYLASWLSKVLIHLLLWQPAIVNENGLEISGECSGYLCIKAPWPGMMRTLQGDHARYETTYFAPFKGFYFSGDGCRR